MPYVKRLQVGLLVYAPGAVLGLDLIGGRGLYARLHQRLLMSYLLDALAMRGVGPAARRRSNEPPRFEPRSYLDRVHSTYRTSAHNRPRRALPHPER